MFIRYHDGGGGCSFGRGHAGAPWRRGRPTTSGYWSPTTPFLIAAKSWTFSYSSITASTFYRRGSKGGSAFGRGYNARNYNFTARTYLSAVASETSAAPGRRRSNNTAESPHGP